VAIHCRLVGGGRTPNVEDLNLEAAGVTYDAKQGVHVNDRLQTTNCRIFAAGDICSRYKFTHLSDAHARIVIQNALFFGRAKASALVLPWCTYTDPEIAHVGLYDHEAQADGGACPVTYLPSRPETHCLGRPEPILRGHNQGWVTGAAVVAALLGLGFTCLERSLRRELWLSRHGQAVVGRVLDHGKVRMKNSLSYWVSYAFFAPDGPRSGTADVPGAAWLFGPSRGRARTNRAGQENSVGHRGDL
jgi:hypothetical protein